MKERLIHGDGRMLTDGETHLGKTFGIYATTRVLGVSRVGGQHFCTAEHDHTENRDQPKNGDQRGSAPAALGNG